ncbi:DUF742 domain-containing protein [Crossiella cryophila]|uniref:DUF742 domain-containing protein n=1 Tax=Crossiella cryophila TaxID=43355 RepID=A0A7W7CL78_9PSEU|nr:DUF742 domain-containing protein [Crossiella cryophila]MBB4681856.1 hypothetical protein [Crossiella cryophila]
MSDAPRLPDPRMIPAAQPRSWFDPIHGDQPQNQPPPVRADSSVEDTFVRPFIVTGGRTRPLHDGLRVDTMVGAAPAALSAPLAFERRRIIELCQTPRSVAEIAALLTVPVGVAQVLIADLVTGGLLSLKERAELPVHVIERIRDLVRAL